MFDAIAETASRRPTMTEPTYEAVRRRFIYRDGGLYYATDVFRLKAGDPAFWLGDGGRRKLIYYDGRNYAQARMVWLWHHGRLPAKVARDDGDLLNDSLENLIEIQQPQEAKVFMHAVETADDGAPEPAPNRPGLSPGQKAMATALAGQSCAMIRNGDLWHVFDGDHNLLGKSLTVAESYALWCQDRRHRRG